MLRFEGWQDWCLVWLLLEWKCRGGSSAMTSKEGRMFARFDLIRTLVIEDRMKVLHAPVAAENVPAGQGISC